MSNFMPAGESDFDSADEYGMFEPGVYSSRSKNIQSPFTNNATSDVIVPPPPPPPPPMTIPAHENNERRSVTLTPTALLKIPANQNNELRSAIIYGEKIIFEKLISKFHSADILLRCEWTPLMYACYFAQPEIAEICLRRGACVNYAIQDGSTPLLKACQSPKSEDDVVKCVEHLVVNDVQLLKTDEKTKSCLIIAAREGKLKLLKLILQSATCNIKKNLIDLCDCSGWNALDWAVAKEHFDCAKELLGQGATASLSRSELVIKSGEETLLKVWPKSTDDTGTSRRENENNKDNDCEKIADTVKPDVYDENQNICIEKAKTDGIPSGDFTYLKTPQVGEKLTNANSEVFNQKSVFEKIEQQVIPHEDEYIPSQPPLKEDDVNEDVGGYIEYGQLELFLNGLDLSHTTPIFHQHDIRFEQLLCLTMKDLETIGIRQLGVRKRILNAVHQCHTEQWANTSIPDFTERAMSVDEIVQVLTNLEEHSRYMASSIRFIELKIKSFPEILQTPANEQIKKPHRHEMLEKIHDLIPSLHKLCRATKNLDICLTKQALPDSVDFVQPPTKNKRSIITRAIPLALLSFGCFVFYKLKTN